jgi:hypothetical protein
VTTKKAVVWIIIALVVLSFVGLDLYYALNP